VAPDGVPERDPGQAEHHERDLQEAFAERLEDSPDHHQREHARADGERKRPPAPREGISPAYGYPEQRPAKIESAVNGMVALSGPASSSVVGT